MSINVKYSCFDVIHVKRNLAVDMNAIIICRYEYIVTYDMKCFDMNAPHQDTYTLKEVTE